MTQPAATSQPQRPPIKKGTETAGTPAADARWRTTYDYGSQQGKVLGYVESEEGNLVRFQSDSGEVMDIPPVALMPAEPAAKSQKQSKGGRPLTDAEKRQNKLDADVQELARQAVIDSQDDDFDPKELRQAASNWAKDGEFSYEEFVAALVKEIERRPEFRRKAGVLAELKKQQPAAQGGAEPDTTEEGLPGAGSAGQPVEAAGVEGTPKKKTKGSEAVSPALREAMERMGLDPDAPADKARELRKKADALQNEARKMVEGIPPGQPVMTVTDQNRRERAAEKSRKAADLFAQADKLDAEQAAEPFTHSGLKVYPTRVKQQDGSIKQQWAVQTAENAAREQRGERQIGGDELVDTREQAIQRAEEMAARAERDAKSKAELEAKEREQAEKDAASKAEAEDIDGFMPNATKLVRGRIVKTLSTPIMQGGKQTTRKALVRERVAAGAKVEQAKEGRRLVMPSGAYLGEDQISKTAMDYAEHLIAQRGAEPAEQSPADKWASMSREQRGKMLDAAFGAGQTDAAERYAGREWDKFNVGQQASLAAMMSAPATQPAQATHQDPGEKPEAATKAVVAESLQKAAKNEGMKPSEMKKWLLGEIDKALADIPGYKDFLDLAKSMGDKPEKAAERIGNQYAEDGHVTFNVPGDGRFKVAKSVRNLYRFRDSVEKSPAFRDTERKTTRPVIDSVRNGSRSKEDAVIGMIEDGDFEAAKEYAEAVGIDIKAVKVPRGEMKPAWEQYLKDGTLPAAPAIARLTFPVQLDVDSLLKAFPSYRSYGMTEATLYQDGEIKIKSKSGMQSLGMAQSSGGNGSFMAAYVRGELRKTDKVPETPAKPEKPKDTGWNMAGTGFAGKRYIGRNMTLDDGREVVARVYENAGAYEEAEVKVDGVRKFTVTDRYKAQEKADAFIQTLTAKEPEIDLMGFTRTPMGNGIFQLRDGNLLVEVRPELTGLQAVHGSAKSSPRLTEQQAVDWAANIRDESKKLEGDKPQAAQEPGATDIGWDTMSPEQRTQILSAPGGWSTAKGGLNAVGKGLAKRAWADIVPATRKTIEGLVAKVGSGTAQPASKTPTVDAHEKVMEAVREGTATPEQFKASFESVVANKEAIVAELGTKTKAELIRDGGYMIRMRYANESKPEIVDAFYRELVGEYVLGETLSYGMGKGAYEAAVRRHVEATDADKLAQYAKDRAAAVAEAQAKREARAAALDNPQTLDDYRNLLNAHIMTGKTRKEAFLMLTPEQRVKYDELEAESTREARERRKRELKTSVRAAGQTTGGEIIATKHTRDGYDLYVVQLADRVSKEDYQTLLSSAKRMGGWYSSFRGNGAVPGFQFKDRAQAEAFKALAGGDTAAAEEQVAARRDAFEDDRSQSAVERLTAMADKLDEQAEQALNVERKTNTARRARFASAAEDAARQQQALAKTMRNIAQAIEAGKAKFLDSVRTKTQVEMLAGAVRTAKDNELRAKYDSYGEQQKRKGQPPTAETADYAEFPSFTAFRSDLASLARQMLEVDGTKKMGAQLMKVADDVTDAYMEFAKANQLQVSQFGNKAGGLAVFASREDAERAIKRSGLVGKAIVLPVKRGENRVILSPSEAMSRGIWTGDGDKRITLSREFGQELVDAIGRRGNKTNGLSVPWQFESAADRLKAMARIGIETPAEFRSALREFIGLQEQAKEADRVKMLERDMVGRKNDGLDFFPTPQTVADQMVEAAGIEPDMAVLEPSAGMGHIADRIREAGAEPDVIEMANDRAELLEAKGFNVLARDFMEIKPRESYTFGDVFKTADGIEGIMRGAGGMGSNRVRLVNEAGDMLGYYDRDELTGVRLRGTESGYDRIIMNPPFSDRRDAEHVRHAFELLRPGGRLVAIMGEGVFFGKDKKAQDFRDWLEEKGGTAEKLPEGSFMDPTLPVNTAVNARMVVIDKPGAQAAKADDAPMFSRSKAARPVAPVSRNPDKTPLYEALRQLSRFDQSFQIGYSEAKELDQIARDMTAGRDVSEFIAEKSTELHQGNRKPTLTLKTKNKAGEFVKILDIFEADSATPFVVIGNSELGQNVGGAYAYQMAFTWAHNNGKRMVPDPAGLTVINRLRRTEAMISSALRHGTTKHLEPHVEQYVALTERMQQSKQEPEDLKEYSRPDLFAQVDALKNALWTNNDDADSIASNVQHLAEASAQLAAFREPNLRRLEFADGALRKRGDVADIPLEDADIDGATGKVNIRGVVLQPARSGVGSSTVQRYAVVASVGRALQAGKSQVRGTDRQDGGVGRTGSPALAAIRQVLGDISRGPSDGLKGVFYSRGQQAGALTRESTQQIADAISARWANAPEIIVARDMSDYVIPQLARDSNDAAKSAGATGEPDGFIYQGKVYLIADQLRSSQDVARVLFHEALGHAGLRGAFGDELKPILRQIALVRAKDVRAKAKEYGLDMAKEVDRLKAAEEVLANMAQTAPELGFVKRAIAAIRTWLRNNVALFRDSEITDDEIIRDYILPARGFIERGREAAAPGAMPVFSLRQRAPIWRSALRDGIERIPAKAQPASGWAAQVQGLVNKGQVKADEIEWSGLADWLKLQTGKVTRDQVLEYLDGNGVRVEEVTLTDEEYELQEDPQVEEKDDGTWAVMDPDTSEQIGGDYATEEDAREAVAEMVRRSDGAAKYRQYVLPGGQNYREVLLTLPVGTKPAWVDRAGNVRSWIDAEPSAEVARAMEASGLRRQAMPLTDVSGVYKSGHWDQPNVIAHIRLNDRTDADGKRVLFVEEIQSDWGQEGKKKGFGGGAHKEGDKFTVVRNGEQRTVTALKDTANGLTLVEDESGSRFNVGASEGVPAAPFVTKTDAWLNLALKRIITMAAQEGYDRVAFVNGEQSADRYKLSKQVELIDWKMVDDAATGATRRVFVKTIDREASFTLRVNDEGVVVGDRKDGLDGKSLDDVVGKGVASKIMETPAGELAGDGLEIGGEGMKAFYDKIVPNAAKDLLKKLGGGQMEAVLLEKQATYDPEDGVVSGIVDFGVWPKNGAFELRRRGGGIVGTFKTSDEAFTEAVRLQNIEKRTQPGFTITPAMRERAAQGLPMFSRSNAPAQTSRAATFKTAASRATDLLNEAFAHPGKLSFWDKSVGSMYHIAQRYPAFRRVFNSAQNFINDVSYYATEAAEQAPKILPRLETWRDLAKSPIKAADNNAIARPILEGTLSWTRDEDGSPVRVDDIEAAGIVWRDGELRSMFNLTDDQIALYREFRAATDLSLDNMGKADLLRYAGKDLEDLRDMVMDAPDVMAAAKVMRGQLQELADADPERSKELIAMAGDLEKRAERVQNLKRDGYAPLSRFGRYTVDVVVDGERRYFSLFDTARDANKMAAKMRAEFGADAVSQGTLSQREFEAFQGITPESLELFGNMLGLDSTGDEAQDKVFQTYLRLTKANRSALKRLIHRKGVAGYSDDMGRVLAAFVYSNARQTSAALHMGEMGQAVQDIPKGQGELKDVAIELSSYIKQPREEAQALRGLLFAQYLGGSVASAFVNFTQPFTVTFPYLIRFGGARRSAQALMKAMADQRDGVKLEDGLARALKTAEEQGVVAPQEVHQLMAQARGESTLKAGDGTRAGEALAATRNAWTRTALAWGKLFGMAEQINRRSTFIAAYRIAAERGMRNPSAFATKAVNETQFVNNRANKARWARGPVGATLMTFKSYSVHYMELMHRLATREGPEGKKAAAMMLGMLLLVAGAGGLPFVEDAEDVVDMIAQRMGYNFSTKQAKRKFLEDLFGQAGAEFVEKGITGIAGSPIDISGRMSMANLIPGTGLLLKKPDQSRDMQELVGPVGDLVKRGWKGADLALSGEFGKALLEVSPRAVANAAKGVDMATTGVYTDTRGRKVIETDLTDAAAKAIGFQPQSVARVQDATFTVQKMVSQNKMREAEIAEKWAQGIYEGNKAKIEEAREALRDWNRKNPKTPIRIELPQILKRVRAMRMSKEDRIAKTAPSEIRGAVQRELAAQ